MVVIPARMASSRLPNKPLAEIDGRAMVLRVADAAHSAGIGQVVIAAGDEAIKTAAEAAGHACVLTDPALPSGTDRVRAAIDLADPERTCSVVLNLQGDAPFIAPEDIRRAAALLDDGDDYDVGTLAAPVEVESIADNPDAVKVVIALRAEAQTGTALYFSRSATPWGEGSLYHHVGVYAYRRSVLDRFCAAPPSPLELREKLEQLRGLELGLRYGVALTETAPLSVDTPRDLERARRHAALIRENRQ